MIKWGGRWKVNARSMTIMPFQGLATGSLFYVVFFEILEKERQKNVNGLLQVLMLWWWKDHQNMNEDQSHRWLPCLQATYSWCCSGLPRFDLREQKLFKLLCSRYFSDAFFLPINSSFLSTCFFGGSSSPSSPRFTLRGEKLFKFPCFWHFCHAFLFPNSEITQIVFWTRP